MVLMYVAGPYRAASEWQLQRNIYEAEAVALALWRAGIPNVCPHKNTAHFGGACDDGVFLAGDLVIMRRCDAVVVTRRWEESAGAIAEVAEARRLELPVFLTVGDAVVWARQIELVAAAKLELTADGERALSEAATEGSKG